jgi:hypothetical protein
MQDTCRTSHKEETHFFNFTAHADEGLLCTDCHLETKSNLLGNGHSQVSHTFSVGSDTCTACHSPEMHEPQELVPPSNDSTHPPTEYLEAGFLMVDDNGNSAASPQPSSHSPYNFVILASLSGMAFGLVGSPWLEKWQDRLRNQKDGGSNEQ